MLSRGCRWVVAALAMGLLAPFIQSQLQTVSAMFPNEITLTPGTLSGTSNDPRLQLQWVRSAIVFSPFFLFLLLLAIVVFAWAALLGTGDVAAYTAVCIASGIALGADLTLPGALLAGVIQRAGHAGRSAGSYFGWWNFATKLNLALAAGIALPALAAAGYVPGARDEAALSALSLAYGALPCALKLLAAALLWRGLAPGAHRRQTPVPPSPANPAIDTAP